MNRNNEAHFAQTPTATIGRSKFERPKTVKNTFNEGMLVPIYTEQYVPGDTVKMRMSSLIRMLTPICPVMDEAVCDVYFFNVPWRLLWSHTKQFVGENDTAPWARQTEYEIPQITSPASTGWAVGSLADHLGFPVGVPNLKHSVMPFRAYTAIYNNWFRSEAVQTPIYMHDDDADTTGINYDANTYNPVTDTEKGACCLNACKTFDYFTGCLPTAQCGPAVQIPLGSKAPVIFGEPTEKYSGTTYASSLDGKEAGLWSHFDYSQTQYVDTAYNSTDGGTLAQPRDTSVGLFTDLSSAIGATITQLRQSFAIQKFYERSGMVGNRYGEVIRGHFSVTNPDYRNMIPEYLGGYRIPISINQVVQTSSTDAVSPQGNTAAYSVTVDRKDDLFTKSFTEWGIIMGLAVVRIAHHSYQQGIDREWSKKKKFDFYWPEFANLSNQAVLNKELYAQGSTVVDSDGKVIDEQAFGYQEAWAEMRYSKDEIHGELRNNAPQPLSVWHWGDYYQSKPTLSSDWIQEDNSIMQRSVAVQNHDQFKGDFYFGAIWTRPMPVYSVPGLIDHH